MKAIWFKLHSLDGVYEKVLTDYNKAIILINDSTSKFYLWYITDVYGE